MITNFEKETEKLTPKELLLIPILEKGFSHTTIKNPIKGPDIVKSMNEFLNKKKSGIKMDERMLRKCIGHIRRQGTYPIIATSHGYFISYEADVILDQIKSLTDRANSMIATANELKKWLK